VKETIKIKIPRIKVSWRRLLRIVIFIICSVTLTAGLYMGLCTLFDVTTDKPTVICITIGNMIGSLFIWRKEVFGGIKNG